jgi:CBS domain containing-hemolysin-like protein
MPDADPATFLTWAALLLGLLSLAWQIMRTQRIRGDPGFLPRMPFWLGGCGWVLLGLLLVARRHHGLALHPAAWLVPALGLLATALLRLSRAEVPRVIAEERLTYTYHVPSAVSPDAPLDWEDRRLVLRLLSLRRRRVAELMAPLARVATLREGSRVGDALALFRNSGVWRIPFLDRAGMVARGVIDCRDLALAAVAQAQGTLSPEAAAEDLQQHARPIPTLAGSQPAADAVEALRENGRGLVAVLDRGGHVIGFVAWGHIFQALLGRRGEEVSL